MEAVTAVYSPELFRETEEQIPEARLLLYEDRAHGGRHLRRTALRQGRRGFPESRASGVGLRRHGLVLDGAPPFENQHRFSE